MMSDTYIDIKDIGIDARSKDEGIDHYLRSSYDKLEKAIVSVSGNPQFVAKSILNSSGEDVSKYNSANQANMQQLTHSQETPNSPNTKQPSSVSNNDVVVRESLHSNKRDVGIQYNDSLQRS